MLVTEKSTVIELYDQDVKEPFKIVCVIRDDAVHPNPNGYRQMGDALAGMVEKLRHRK